MQIYKHLVYFSNMSRGLFKMLPWTFQNARVDFSKCSCEFCKLLVWILQTSRVDFSCFSHVFSCFAVRLCQKCQIHLFLLHFFSK